MPDKPVPEPGKRGRGREECSAGQSSSPRNPTVPSVNSRHERPNRRTSRYSSPAELDVELVPSKPGKTVNTICSTRRCQYQSQDDLDADLGLKSLFTEPLAQRQPADPLRYIAACSQLPYIPVCIQGQTLKALIDTGASRNLIWAGKMTFQNV